MKNSAEFKVLRINELKITPDSFADLIKMIGEKRITSRVAKDVLALMFEKGGSPERIIEEKGLIQASDEESIKELAKKIIKANPKPASDFKAGKDTALKFLIGQGMKETKGSVNPQILEKIFKKMI
jgi:aspartyl-tRNA(Asn)/glutamyl-tRNA(Gln) amidotransferase subunit B